MKKIGAPVFAVKMVPDYVKPQAKKFGLKKAVYSFVILTMVVAGLNFPPSSTRATAVPLACQTGAVTLLNPGFETPAVESGAWNIFPSGTSDLGWTVGWVGSYTDAPATANLELHNGVNGWVSAQGSQYAELDADWDGPSGSINNEQASVVISQTVSVVPNATYQLSFKLSPRPGTDSSQNNVRAQFGSIDQTNSFDGTSNSNTVWSNFSYPMVNDSSVTQTLQFTDLGTPDSYGMFIDDVRLELTQCPAQTGNLIICKYNDVNQDAIKDENDTPLQWPFTVQYPGDGGTLSTGTNADTGCVTIADLPLGEYVITEDGDNNTSDQTTWVKSNPTSGSQTINLTVDGATTTFLNYPDINRPTGSIHGYKWNDLDGDGQRGEERLLSGWTIFIDEDDDGRLDDGETSMVTSDSDNHFGWYWFENLPDGDYSICEVNQTGWTQTYPENCHSVTLPDDNSGGMEFSVNAVAGPEYNFGNQQNNLCVDETVVLDEVPAESLASWVVTNTGGNPIFSYSEITSPYDQSTAIQTSVVGDTVMYCPSQSLNKTYMVNGNTSTSVLKAYLAFTSSMDEYNFPYVTVYLYDSQDALIGYQVYYGKGVISGIYAGYAAADPAHYTELSAASGDLTMDLSKIATNADFSKVVVYLSNYACVGTNSVTFDHLRLVNACSDNSADLELTKTVDASNVVSGQQATFTLHVINNGPDTAQNLVVTDALPTGLTYVSSTATVGDYDSNTNKWTVGSLANGETATLTMVTTVSGTEGQQIVNGASVDLDPNIDINSENNSGSATVTVVKGEDLVCKGSGTYTVNADFDKGALINVNYTPANQLQLDDAVNPFGFIWVANSGEGTIVKMNTETGEVMGEYKTSPDGTYGNPSRTTVDKDGSVWVGNRQAVSGGHAAITHVGLVENGQCEDRNSNGVIDTSTGLNDVKAWTDESGARGVATAQDECIVHFTKTSGSDVRHISVDSSNNIWVSGINNRVFEYVKGGKYNIPGSGTILRTEGPVEGGYYGGYGGLIDSNNVIWSASNLLRWNTANPLTGPNGGNWTGYDHSSYGLCIDSQGNVFNTEYGPNVYKHAPDGTLLATFSHGTGSAQGCVVDKNDDLWVAGSLSGNTVDHLKNDGTFVGSVSVGSGPTGVAVDNNGKVWVTNHYSQTVMRIDPTAGPMGADGVTKVGAVDFTSPDIGGYLYNYSDMTGSTLSGKAESGTWTVIHDGEVGTFPWKNITWNADVPSGASLSVTVAPSADGITFDSPISVTSGQSLASITARYLKVVVSFQRSPEGVSSILYDLSLNRDCGEEETDNGGSSSSSTSGGGGGGSGYPVVTGIVPPTGQVLGETTFVPSSELPMPQVLGESTTLPRTGIPISVYLLILGAAVALLDKKLKLV